MAKVKDTVFYGVIKHAVFVVLASVLLTLALDRIGYKGLELNFSEFYQSIVTFTTGAMIAVFLGVFFSEADRMKYIREHKGSFTLFIAIILNLLVIVGLGLIVDKAHYISVFTSVIIVTTLDIVYLIMCLVKISLNK